MHRTMHILDVISSVSRSSKCTKIVGGWDFAPDPTSWGADTAPETPIADGFKGAYFKAQTKGSERRGMVGGAKTIYAPAGRQKASRRHCSKYARMRLQLGLYPRSCWGSSRRSPDPLVGWGHLSSYLIPLASILGARHSAPSASSFGGRGHCPQIILCRTIAPNNLPRTAPDNLGVVLSVQVWCKGEHKE